MTTAKFIDSSEIDLVRYLFSHDKTMVGVLLSDSELEERINKIKNRLDEGQLKVVIVFDDDGSPYCMYTGFFLKRISGWYIGATKIYKSENHFNISAKKISVGLDLLIDYMENQGFYKFWMAAPVWQHNIRNKVMKKYSERLARYEWFDECLIPKGTKSNIEAYEVYRYVCDWADVMIRMFVLKQEYREVLVQKKYEQDIELLEKSRT